MPNQPRDFAPGAAAPARHRVHWSTWTIPIVLALLVPSGYMLIAGGRFDEKLVTLAQATSDNERQLDELDEAYVPRKEVEAKLETIQVQIGAVQASVEAAKEQSEKETAQILRKLDRIERQPPPP